MTRAVWIFLALFCSACVSQLVEPQAKELLNMAEAKPAPAPVKLAWDKPEWTKHLLHDLADSSLLKNIPSDISDFCPGYLNLDESGRREVWAQLISIMAKRESGFKPETKYQEDFKDSKGRWVISRGLLQISQESANSYKCGITKAEMLHDPNINLSCGVKIIERWVPRDGMAMGKPKLNKGCGRYWSVCRASSRSYEVVRGYLKALPICK